MYGPKNSVDKRALKAVTNFNPLAGGRYDPESMGGLSEAEFDFAVESGLLFRPNQIVFSHEEAVTELLAAVEATDQEAQVGLFLASLSTNRLDYRVGLGALALARTFPSHPFTPRTEGPNCLICGLKKDYNAVDRNFCNRTRFRAGAPVEVEPTGLAFYLRCQRQLSPAQPTELDLQVFLAILQVLSHTPADETAKKYVMTELKSLKGFKSSTEERQFLLQSLGYCGILETPEHGDMLHRYINLGLAPRKTRSSDWKYPVDFWTGKDGLNKRSLRFWFGGHPQLTSLMTVTA